MTDPTTPTELTDASMHLLNGIEVPNAVGIRVAPSVNELRAIEAEAAAAERERLLARVIEHDGAGILTATDEWPLGIWLSPEDFLAEPSDD